MKQRNWVPVFSAIALLTLAQVGWWATTFVREVGTIEQVSVENLELRSRLGELAKDSGAAGQALSQIHQRAFRRRLMFLSETIFFALLTCFGFWLLYRALKVEERARESERSFIETVTHESKTPLTALKLRLESARERWGTDGGMRRELDLALQEVRRLHSVFEKTLNLNRIERHAMQFEALSLSDIVRDVLRRLDPLIREKAVSVTLELDDEAVVQGDLYGLQNSVQSLIENAILYNSGSDRRLAVAVVRRYPKIVLSVRDNGPGIHRDDRDRIFQRFYRGKSGSGAAGTGLGLYLTKTIVEAHQGSLKLIEGGATGAHFEIELPASVSG